MIETKKFITAISSHQSFIFTASKRGKDSDGHYTTITR